MVRAGDTCLALVRLFGGQRTPSQEELVRQLHYAEAELSIYLAKTLPQHQQDALVAWAMSVMGGVTGPQASIKESELVRRINAVHYQLAAAEFTKWVYRNGKVDHGMVKQRAAEQRLFLTGRVVVA